MDVSKDNSLKASLLQEISTIFDFLDEGLLEILIIMSYDDLECPIKEGSIDTAAITTCLAIMGILLSHFPYFDDERLVSGILDLEHIQWLVISNEGTFFLNLLANHVVLSL